jgi:hypothetical protein
MCWLLAIGHRESCTYSRCARLSSSGMGITMMMVKMKMIIIRKIRKITIDDDVIPADHTQCR